MNKTIREFQRGRVMQTLTDGKVITVFIPTSGHFVNAKVLEVEENCFSVHWLENFNLDGDFSSELMKFGNDCVMCEEDKKKRNTIRKENGLMPIK